MKNNILYFYSAILRLYYRDKNTVYNKIIFRWSVEHYDKFWDHMWHFMNIEASQQPDCVINILQRMDEIPKWFEGARLNYAENLLRYPDDNKIAFYYTSER